MRWQFIGGGFDDPGSPAPAYPFQHWGGQNPAAGNSTRQPFDVPIEAWQSVHLILRSSQDWEGLSTGSPCLSCGPILPTASGVLIQGAGAPVHRHRIARRVPFGIRQVKHNDVPFRLPLPHPLRPWMSVVLVHLRKSRWRACNSILQQANQRQRLLTELLYLTVPQHRQ